MDKDRRRPTFLSTPSVRRATRPGCQAAAAIKYFYPRPPCGGRPVERSSKVTIPKFLSTPSVRRATGLIWINCQVWRRFLSTPSVRRATKRRTSLWKTRFNFYPRPPCGGRHSAPVCVGPTSDFYPRPPCGGRLHRADIHRAAGLISIHALRAEGDSHPARCRSGPCTISIHALRAEGDLERLVRWLLLPISIHALRAEGDRILVGVRQRTRISIHALRAEGDVPGSGPQSG